jgi:hypothetical protein
VAAFKQNDFDATLDIINKGPVCRCPVRENDTMTRHDCPQQLIAGVGFGTAVRTC